MGSYTIGTLASAAGVRRDTIRYYERIGLLRPAERTAAGYRLYGEQDLDRLNFVRTAQRLGFTLSEAGDLLAIRGADSARAADVLRVTEVKLGELRSRVAQLQAISRALQDLAANCPVDAPASDCPILAYLSGRKVGAPEKTSEGGSKA